MVFSYERQIKRQRSEEVEKDMKKQLDRETSENAHDPISMRNGERLVVHRVR